MYLFHGIDIANVDSVGAGPNDRALMNRISALYLTPFWGLFIPLIKVLTIFLVQFMNIVWDFPGEPIVDVDNVGPFRDRRTWNARERTGQPAVNEVLY
jgi:hypothetical protein